MNSESSRSHAVLTLKLNNASLSFVDLAGSERLKRTLCRGRSARESIAINSGLLALANVISALSARKSHVPFRDSKLTRILQPCLSTKLLFIACVSPLLSDLPETANTLMYAARAASISSSLVSLPRKLGTRCDSSRLEIVALQREISRLKDENQRLRAQLKTGAIEGHPYVQRLEAELRVLRAEQRLAAPVPPFLSADSVEQCAISVLATEEQQRAIEVRSIVQGSSEVKGSECSRQPIADSKEKEERCSGDSGGGKRSEANSNSSSDARTVRVDNPAGGYHSEAQNRTTSYCSQEARSEQFYREEQAKSVDSQRITDTVPERNEANGSKRVNSNNPKQPGGMDECSSGSLTRIDGKRRIGEKQQQTQHKRIVTFDLEPRTRRGVATPRREALRIAPVLVSSMPLATTALAPAENFPVACLADGQIVALRERAEELFKEKEAVTQLSFSPSFGLFYTTGSVLKIFSSSDRPKLLYACKALVTALEVFGSTLVMGHADGSITLFDLVSSRVLMSDRVHAGAILAVAREGEMLYTGSLDHSIRCVRAGQRGPWPALEPPHYGAISTLLEYRGLLVSAGRDGALKTWRQGVPFKTVAGAHPAAIRSGAVVESPGCWVTGCRAGELRCWDLTDGTVRCVGKADNGQSIERLAGIGSSVWVAGTRELRRYELR